MSVIWPNKIESVLRVGISLEQQGINSWALSKTQALEALDSFATMQIPILGGDVCESVNGNINHNYDSWHCDRMPNESDKEFLARSISKAKEYIRNYNIEEVDKIFFVLVPSR